MADKYLMTDGTKAKSINPYTDETPGVWSPDPVDAAKQAKSTRLVPSVFAGISTRMNAMADLPFTVYGKGDKEIDNSDDYKNVTGFLPNPFRYLGLTEMSLVAAGKAYWFKGTGAKTGLVKELQYWIPSSVTLDPEQAKKRIIEFRRQGVNELFKGEQVLYHWLYDENVEFGAPTIFPLESAMIAAEANGAITTWVRDYMKRGAIKAMLLAVEGMPPAAEVTKIENWWNRFMSGARGLVWKVFNAANVKPTIVGDGLEALKDLSVQKDLRYAIHEALGTRHLLEDENYATAHARERQFYTQTIMPDARLIQNALNEQILHSVGQHWEFDPERLEIFRENEVIAAPAVYQITQAIELNPKASALAMDIVGYKVDDELRKKLEAYQKEHEQAKKEQQKADAELLKQQAAQKEKPNPNAKALVELDKWQAKVGKAGKMVTWHAVELQPAMVKAISNGDITFDAARLQLQDIKASSEALAVIDSLRAALIDG